MTNLFSRKAKPTFMIPTTTDLKALLHDEYLTFTLPCEAKVEVKRFIGGDVDTSRNGFTLTITDTESFADVWNTNYEIRNEDEPEDLQYNIVSLFILDKSLSAISALFRALTRATAE